MALDPVIPRSRRALLLGGVGGLAAAALGFLGRPERASAANGDPLTVGQTNTATSETSLTQQTASTGALRVVGTTNSNALNVENSVGNGIFALTGGAALVGESINTYGVAGTSHNLYGVYGTGPVGVLGTSTATGMVGYAGSPVNQVPGVPPSTGVYGYANADTGSRGISGSSPLGQGVVGESASGTGVRGVSSASAQGITTQTGVFGYADQGANARGVFGKTTTGNALRGEATTGIGVRSLATSGNAVQASNASTTRPTISAQNQLTTNVRSAIQGVAGTGTPPAPQAETGVEGISNVSINSIGVYGGSAAGTGVLGNTDNGAGLVGFGYWGVYASGTVGVLGDVDGGTGVQGWTGVAGAPNPLAHVGVLAGAENGRIALQVNGVGKFNRSGRASIAVGTSSRKITVPGGVTTAAFGIATLQTNRAGYYVQAVVPSASTSSITVYLNKAVTTTAISVGWIVFS